MCTSKRCEDLPVCRAKAVPSSLIHFKTLSMGLFPARTGLSQQEKKEGKERERPLSASVGGCVSYHACCLVPVRRLSRPSRSTHFSDVPGTNGRETQKLSRTTWPEMHRPRTKMRPRELGNHACTRVSLTTNNLLVKYDTTYRTGLRDNNCGLRNFQRAVSTGHAHSTENETGFETSKFRLQMWSAATWKDTSRPAEVSFFPIIFLLS